MINSSVHCSSGYRCIQCKIFIEKAIFCYDNAFFSRLNASTCNCWILSKIWIHKFHFNSWSLCLNNNSSLFTSILLKIPVLNLNVSVIITVRKKQPSLINVIVCAVYLVNQNLLNDIFILWRSSSDRKHLLCTCLSPILNCNRGLQLIINLHYLAFRVTHNIFKIDVFNWDNCIRSIKVIIEQNYSTCKKIMKILYCNIFKLCKFVLPWNGRKPLELQKVNFIIFKNYILNCQIICLIRNFNHQSVLKCCLCMTYVLDLQIINKNSSKSK